MRTATAFPTGAAVETAIKLARQYWKLRGQHGRTKVISRYLAYHGTTMGALSLTGVPSIKTPFEPLMPGAIKVQTASTTFTAGSTDLGAASVTDTYYDVAFDYGKPITY